jgi:tetratricopeptide (TPR) repeat protein
MPDETFDDMARRAAQEGAAVECAAGAEALERRAEVLPRQRAEALQRAARGLRTAARILLDLKPPPAGQALRPPGAGLGPAGCRGALAAGHLALARGRPAQAELVGEGLHEARPRDSAGLRLVGQALFAQGRYRPAARAFRAALAADSHDAYTRALHAEALWFAGECEVALSALSGLKEARGPGAALAAALEGAFRSGAVPRRSPGLPRQSPGRRKAS